jgi:hypothetical protein
MKALFLRSLPITIVLGSLAFLYFHLFVPPFTPIWTGGDGLVWLHDANRMLNGEVLYRDIAETTFPATALVYLAAFKLFGPQMWIPNMMLLIVGTALAWLIYRIGRSIGLGHVAVLPVLLFLTLIYRDRLDPTHHWYSTLATIAALAVFIDQRSPGRLAIAGAFCGLAAGFTQSAGLMTLFAFIVFLYWEHLVASTKVASLVRRELLLTASFIAVALIVCGYSAWQAGFTRFIYCTLWFNLRYYGSFVGANTWQGYMSGLPEFLQWQKAPGLVGFLLVHALLPLVYILFFVRYHRDSQNAAGEHWDRLMLVSLVGFFSLFSVAAAPTWARLYYLCLPALILFTWILKSEGKSGRILFNSLLVFATTLLLAFPVAKQMHWRSYLDLPVGRTAFLNREAYERYRLVAAETQPSDFFFGGMFPDFYFTLKLRNPGPISFISPYDYTRPEEVQEFLTGLERNHVKIVLWTSALDLPANTDGDHLAPLRAYIRHHYRVVQNSPQFEVWSRTD